MIRYGMGENVSHRGGHAVWQIINARERLFGRRQCTNPRDAEHEMLAAYRIVYIVLLLYEGYAKHLVMPRMTRHPGA